MSCPLLDHVPYIIWVSLVASNRKLSKMKIVDNHGVRRKNKPHFKKVGTKAVLGSMCEELTAW